MKSYIICVTRHIILGTLLLALSTGMAFAQTDDKRAWGYVFFGPGGGSGGGTTLHVGAGGEGLAYKGLGIGGEVGYLAPTQGLGNGVGLFSANAAYHVRTRGSSQKLVPFVTGGYSLLFRSGSENGFNLGGGVQYWAGERVGLRLEFRDHILSSDKSHLYGFRVGFAFR